MALKRASVKQEVGPVLKKPCPSVSKDEYWDLESPGDRLMALYKHSKLTDLTINFPGHHDQLKVHRLVLAMSSPVFEKMLFGPLAKGDTLNLPEDPPEAFILLIRYMYCGKANMTDVDTTIQVYLLANKYQMNLLRCLCAKYIQQNLSATNLPTIYEAAYLTEDEILLHRCSEVMCHAAEIVLSSPNIGQLSHESMKFFLQQNLCIISEVSVFKGLVEWGKVQASITSNKTPGPENMRQKIEEFLPYVKFCGMTVDEFIEHVMPHYILTCEEVASILMNIKKVSNIPLPSICRNQDCNWRLVLDWKYINQVCFTNRQIYKNENINQNSLSSYQKLISNLEVSKNICVGRMSFKFNYGDTHIKCIKWVVKVTDSEGNVLGIVEEAVRDPESSLKPKYVDEIKATFNTPLFLISNKTYNVWLYSLSSFASNVETIVDYRNLTICGQCYTLGESTLHFWCFDGFDSDSLDSDSFDDNSKFSDSSHYSDFGEGQV